MLSSLHVFATERREGLRNPVLRDNLPRIDTGNTSSSTPVLEKGEIQDLYRASESGLDLLVVELLYTLAGRVGEMCAADVTDRVERGRRSYLDVTRKENKERILPLGVSLAERLDAHTAGRTEGPLLATASLVYQQATGRAPKDRSIALYEAVRAVVVAALPDGENGYGAYQAHLEVFAIRHRGRLRELFTGHGPRLRAGTPGRIGILDHLMSVPLCERLDGDRPAVEAAWGQTLPPLDGLAAAWARTRRRCA
ncbi:hypothetical protein [Streptomyces sp. CBMA156]|uniref:hypothetical protein n=1 Tax=Streptomyces sp. CBMA156 TaxID=1930280 RepID=UPI001661CC05|nr:hypothetical protein [Streptomyces sp. CBMA156]MBD0675662.1 hypothetical protein [Streptomyces sp. CBMA156]